MPDTGSGHLDHHERLARISHRTEKRFGFPELYPGRPRQAGPEPHRPAAAAPMIFRNDGTGDAEEANPGGNQPDSEMSIRSQGHTEDDHYSRLSNPDFSPEGGGNRDLLL